MINLKGTPLRTRVTATIVAALTSLALIAGPAVAETFDEKDCNDPLYLYVYEDGSFVKTYVRCLDDTNGTSYDPVLR